MGNPNTPPGHQGHTDQIPKRVSRWRRKAGPAVRGLVLGAWDAANSDNAVSHVLPHFEITTGNVA
eukprot:scaffold14870_cov119-Isochrysis_galbana.AAC.4